jgi:hypothetical protein
MYVIKHKTGYHSVWKSKANATDCAVKLNVAHPDMKYIVKQARNYETARVHSLRINGPEREQVRFEDSVGWLEVQT